MGETLTVDSELVREISGVRCACTEATKGGSIVKLCTKDASVQMSIVRKAEERVYMLASKK